MIVTKVPSYLLQRFLTVQACGGHLGQEDGHVLLLLPEPDETLAHVGVHHTQSHLLLPAQGLVQLGEVRPHTRASALSRARNLTGNHHTK